MSEQKMRAHAEIDLLALQKRFYLRLVEKNRSPNTLKNYKTDLNCFNQYLVTTKKCLSIGDFEIAQVQEYGKYLDNKYSSDNSRRRRVQALRLFFDFLVEIALYESNPVRKLPTSPKYLEGPRPTTFIELKVLWVHLIERERKSKGLEKLIAKRNEIIFLLIFYGGLKVSDLAKLKHSQISLAKEARVLITHAKRDPYSVLLPPLFAGLYREYCHDLQQFAAKEGREFTEILFNANPYRILSGGLSARGLELVFEELRKKINIHLTPKSLRQACIFNWLHQGHNEMTVKEWLGVAPSFSLKPYQDLLQENIYNENFFATHLALKS